MFQGARDSKYGLSHFPTLWREKQKQQKFAKKFTILDGGMGTALFAAGVPKSSVIWSASALVDPLYHEHVINEHARYIEAGADTITTNNYGVNPFYYMEYYGQDKYQDKIIEHTLLAAQLARLAVQRSGKKVFIYGCLPPCRESLRPDLTNEFLDSPENYKIATSYYKLISNILEPFVDGFLLETINTPLELECALDAIKGVHKSISISMQGSFWDPKDMQTRRPHMAEVMAKKVVSIADTGLFQVKMFALNCAHPDHIVEGYEQLTKETRESLKRLGIELGAYANSTVKEVFEANGFTLEKARPRDKKMLSEYVTHAERWRKLGVTCFGGCCGVTSREIQNLHLHFGTDIPNLENIPVRASAVDAPKIKLRMKGPASKL